MLNNIEKEKQILDVIRNRVKNHPVVQKFWCDEYGLDIEEIDLIPMCFDDIDVSARTDHAIIYFNRNLIGQNFDHYMVHELVHVAQQTTGTKPTKGADSGDYLKNNEEIEGFQNQTEYLSETRDDDTAEEYIEQVLDHHDVHDEGEREEKKDNLLQLARFQEYLKIANY